MIVTRAATHPRPVCTHLTKVYTHLTKVCPHLRVLFGLSLETHLYYQITHNRLVSLSHTHTVNSRSFWWREKTDRRKLFSLVM